MGKPKGIVLIIEDDAEYLGALAEALSAEFTVVTASGLDEAEDKLDKNVTAVLLDVRLRDEDKANRDGLLFLDSIKQLRPELPVVMMTAYGDIDLAVEAMRRGAADFIQKARVDTREFRKVLQNALKRSRLERRVAELEDDLRRFEPWELVGDDPKIHEVRSLVEMVGQDGQCAVLIRGETGTGKELVARAIHARGWRKDEPFVPVALPALPDELLQAELFGCAKGAFTDARESRAGYFEKAKGGVLFLDEIGDLAPAVQPKLLRVLETKTFARVGSTHEITVDVQVVCATNRDLEEAMRQGQFREDFYFRLKTVQIPLPPLRERVADIPLLVDHFLFLFRQQGRTKLAGIAPAALETLSGYAFPGNVRELRAVVERAVMLAEVNRHALIEIADLPLEVRERRRSAPAAVAISLSAEGVNLDEELARTELAYIEQALSVTDGKKTDAWRLLGLNDRFALRRRAKRLVDDYPDLTGKFPLVRRLYQE